MEILDGLDGFDALAGAAQTVLPVVIGGGVAFGVAEAIDFLVKNPTVKKWRWGLGALGSTLIGLGVWKWRSPEEGALVIGSGVVATGVGFGLEKLNAYKATKGIAGLGRYLVQPAQPLLAGRYVVEPGQPLLAGMDASETVGLGNINPGYFG